MARHGEEEGMHAATHLTPVSQTRLWAGRIMHKPRHDLRYTRVHFSRPYPVRTNSNSTNCCVEKDLCACRRRV
jgi:hypothetical protein